MERFKQSLKKEKVWRYTLNYRKRSKEENVESLTVKADLVNLDMVLDFAKRILEKQNAPAEVITQMQFCMDEMFANIAKYAYPDKNGMVIVSADTGQ